MVLGEERGRMMEKNITIRLAVPADAPDMAEVHMRSWEVAYKGIIPAAFIKDKNATRHELYKRVITDENIKFISIPIIIAKALERKRWNLLMVLQKVLVKKQWWYGC